MANDTFRTHKRTAPFTMVQNSLINNQQLSWAAKGILIYLLSKPDGWKVYKADVVKHATNGIDSVKSIIKELRKAGYITLTRIVNEKGKVKEWRYDVYDEPIETPVEKYITVKLVPGDVSLMASYPEHYAEEEPSDTTVAVRAEAPVAEAENPEVENPLLDKQEAQTSRKNPEVDYPQVGNPAAGFPPTSNKDINNIDMSNTQSNLSNSTQDGLDGSGCVTSEREYEQIVDTIKQNIDFDSLVQKPGYDAWLPGWIYLIADMLIGSQPIRVNGRSVPVGIAKKRMLRLTQYEIEHVKSKIDALDYPVKNMTSYIFSSLYNTVNTLDTEMDNDISAFINT